MTQYKENRKKLMDQLDNGEAAIFFSGTAPTSTADSFYEFRADKSFYYFTGITREGFILLMHKFNDEVKETLFIKEPNYDLEKWYGRYLSDEQSRESSSIEDIKYLDTFDQQLHLMVQRDQCHAVYLDLFKLTHDSEGLYAHKFAKTIKEKYPSVVIKNAFPMISELRMIKTEDEIDAIRSAIDLTRKGLERVMAHLSSEQYEYEASAEFNYEIMKGGADGNAFETIAASGDNAVVLHYIENDDVMKDGELVLMDLGAQYQQYASDITRTYPVNGQFSDRQRDLYNLVLKAHDEVIKIMKPGLEFSELNKKSAEVLGQGLIELGLIKDASELGQYYYHGVSHFMGLDTHDVGRREVTLQAGMVLTVEPGLYVAEEAIGIRIEDDVLITEDGHEVLSKDIIRTVEDIESFMKEAK